MKFSLLIVLALLALPVFANNTQNPDVKKFVDTADQCEHFLGEIGGPGTAKEQQRLVHTANHYCNAAKRQFKKLDVKYKADSDVQAILDNYRAELAD